MASLDVEHHVVAIRLVQTDLGRVRATHDRELHLVAIPVRVRRFQDGPELELAEAADALEAIAHLLLLEGELGRVRDVLEPAAATAAEIGAGRLDPVGRRRLERFDDRAAEPGARLHHSDPHPVAWDGAADEEDVALDPADPLAAESEVVDRQIEDIAAPRFRHD